MDRLIMEVLASNRKKAQALIRDFNKDAPRCCGFYTEHGLCSLNTFWPCSIEQCKLDLEDIYSEE